MRTRRHLVGSISGLLIVVGCGGAGSKGAATGGANEGTLGPSPLPTTADDPNVPDIKPVDSGALTPGNCDPKQFMTPAIGAQCALLETKSADATGGAAQNASALSDRDACTTWSSGGMPPAFVLIDLGSEQLVSGVLLVPELTPQEVDMSNVIEVGADTSALHAVAELKGHMIDEHGMIAMLPKPMKARVLRVTTLGSPAWVSWREVAAIQCAPTMGQ